MGKSIEATAWYEYDWQFNGAESVNCVDTSYEKAETDLGTILITLECAAKHSTLTDSEYRTYERLRDKIIRKTGITYVGLIESNDAVRFYFYADEHDITEMIEKIIRRVADKVSCDGRYDKEHDFYFKTLMPDSAKLYTEENRKHIALFAENGDNLLATRKINFHLYFPSDPLRILFEEQARLSGYAVGITEFSMDYELSHGVVVHKISTLNKREIDDATSRLIYIAEKYEGKMMFWDCVLVPKRKGL